MTIIDWANFRQCLYELIENDDVAMELPDKKVIEGLVLAFLAGELVICFDPKSKCLQWAPREALKC